MPISEHKNVNSKSWRYCQEWGGTSNFKETMTFMRVVKENSVNLQLSQNSSNVPKIDI